MGDLAQDEVNQIWAEVLTFKDETLYLPAELEEQAKRAQADAMEHDEREGIVRMYLETLLPENWDRMDLFSRREYLRGDDISGIKGTVERKTVSNIEIWCECFGNTKESLRPADSYMISSIMARIEEWKRAKDRVSIPIYGQQRVYFRQAYYLSKHTV